MSASLPDLPPSLVHNARILDLGIRTLRLVARGAGLTTTLIAIEGVDRALTRDLAKAVREASGTAEPLSTGSVKAD
jgi:hypothetical protein